MNLEEAFVEVKKVMEGGGNLVDFYRAWWVFYHTFKQNMEVEGDKKAIIEAFIAYNKGVEQFYKTIAHKEIEVDANVHMALNLKRMLMDEQKEAIARVKRVKRPPTPQKGKKWVKS